MIYNIPLFFRHCHFGNGKLIFATKNYAQIVSLLNNNIGEKRRKIHATLSSPEVSPIRSPLQKPGKYLSDSSDIILEEEDDDGIVFGANASASYNKIKTNLQRIKSCPNIQNNSNQQLKTSFSDFMTLKSMQDSCPNLDDPVEQVLKPKKSSRSSLTKLKLQRSPVHCPISFSEPSTDNGYIPPANLNLHLNDVDNNEQEQSSHLLLATTPSPETESPLLDQPSSSDSDAFSYPYLHIIDDDSQKDLAKDDDQIDHIRSTVLDELANPQQKSTKEPPIFAPIGIETHFDERRPSSPLPMRKKAKPEQPRRPSEPVKKSVFETIRSKHKTSIPIDIQTPPGEVKKQTSPRLSPKQTTSFPKLISMQQGDVFQQMATTCLLQKIPKSLPSASSTASLPCQRSRPTSRDMDVSVSVELDTPPPLPFRGSPDLLQRVPHQLSSDLTITIREEPNKLRRNTMSDMDSRNHHTITVNSRRTYNPAPPIPPKSRSISLQRSTAIFESKDESSVESSRRSSYAEDNSVSADEIIIDDSPSTPPAVPKRDKVN